MTRNRKLVIGGAAVLALGAGGVGIAQAVGGDSDEQATGPDADRAKQAAVQAVGGGRAVEVEREDDGRDGWEVEVQRNGREIEVHLNRNFQKVGAGSDDDRGENERGGDDD